MVRERFDDTIKAIGKGRTYLHESRHRHAASRQRGSDGRFLAAAEIQALEAAAAATRSRVAQYDGQQVDEEENVEEEEEEVEEEEGSSVE